ncbi:MAG: exosortase F system-associated protein [Solirubrobacteraceae bacterium]
MDKITRILGVLISIFLLICIRNYQEDLFFDPYLKFFEDKELFKEKGGLNEFGFEIMVGVGYRYLLNSVLTLVIIYFVFNNIKLVYQSLFIMLMLFVIIFPIYYFFVEIDFREYSLIGFYVRRILIQPILLILLIPSFYYLEQKIN